MSTPTDDATRATVRQLAAEDMSHRAIAREVGIHHSTVARILRATDEPDAPATAPQDAPPTAPPSPTSGAPRAPRLIHELPPWLIQDLNVLIDARTGRLPAPVARAIHTAAEARRATMRANLERQDRHDPTAAQ
ncbi:helix-turn-helix domain-containing protein [Streptomyces sp. NPDC046900]|uniref:helix-turn-helix domain-containing protein n=1 Tax=Streptomyces sp. NPDC046900 TaxID=3155473 RepID=UPI0033CFCFC1